MYERGGYVFALNFSPNNSYEGYYIPLSRAGEYRIALSSDSECFGGYSAVDESYIYRSEGCGREKPHIRVYLPARVGICLSRCVTANRKKQI